MTHPNPAGVAKNPEASTFRGIVCSTDQAQTK